MERLDGLGNEVTRTAETEREYSLRVAMLERKAAVLCGQPASLQDTIAWLQSQHEEFASATIRSYFAALTWAVGKACESHLLTQQGAEHYYEQLKTRPLPRPDSKPARTSRKKRKSILKTELHRLSSFLRKRRKPEDLLLVLFLIHGITLGLRPSEFSDADVRDCILFIQNRKATNGRGLGATRELDLADCSEQEIQSLRALIHGFATSNQRDLERLMDRLGQRLRRACRRLKIEPIALYTCRHQAIANLKSAGVDAAEIAAVAGHKSIHTAGKHYAKRRSGWGHVATAKATPSMVAKVAQSGVSNLGAPAPGW